MKKKRKRSSKHRPRAAAVVLAGVLASAPVASAGAMPQLTDEAIAKLSPGALRRLLMNLRAEDEQAAKNTPALMIARDHDSHVMHGSHSSFGSHGQHTSFSNAA